VVVFKNCLLFIVVSIPLRGQSECLASLENAWLTGQGEVAQALRGLAGNGPRLKALSWVRLFQGHECPCSLRKDMELGGEQQIPVRE